jgi:hypothetical protein
LLDHPEGIGNAALISASGHSRVQNKLLLIFRAIISMKPRGRSLRRAANYCVTPWAPMIVTLPWRTSPSSGRPKTATAQTRHSKSAGILRSNLI